MNYKEQYEEQKQITDDIANKIIEYIDDNLSLLNMNKDKLKNKFIPWITDINTGEIVTLAYVVGLEHTQQAIALRKQEIIAFINAYPEEAKILVLELKELIIKLKINAANNTDVKLLKEIRDELAK